MSARHMQGTEFLPFQAEHVKGIVAPGCANYTRKQTDELTDFVKKQGAKGLIVLWHDEGGYRATAAPAAKLNDAEKAAIASAGHQQARRSGVAGRR